MKKKITLALAGLVALAAMSFDILSSGGKAGYTGSPSESNCTACHSGTVNSGGGSVAITSSPLLTTGYVPGTVYTITVTVAQTGSTLFGLDVEALLASGANGGTLAITNSSLTKLLTKTVGGNSRNNVVQTGNNNVGPNTQAFSFSWTAPASGSGLITFYASGMAADNTGGTDLDQTYTTSLAVSESTVGISETSANSAFAIYPNPVKGNLNVNYSITTDSKVQISVYSLDGKKVASLSEKNQTAGTYSEQFNVKDVLTKGIYVVELKINDVPTLEKIAVE